DGKLPGAGYEPARRLVPEDAAKEGRHANRPADVGPEAERRRPRAHDGAFSSRAPARHPTPVVWVVRAPVDAVARLHPHAELGDVGHPEHDGARLAQAAH